MFNKIWKSTAGLIVVMLLLLLAGCGGNTEKPKAAAPKAPETKKDTNTVVIGYIAGGQTSPQAIANQYNNIFDEQLKDLGKKVKLDGSRSLDNVWPKMDKDEWDFVYVPTGNFGTYVTKTSKFGGSEKYVLLAGSLNVNGTNVIVAKPGIKSIKDLAGKKVSIANLRYWDEWQLNKLLETEGLATTTMGGNIEVVWDDIVPKQLESWAQGKYDAVAIYTADNIPMALEKLPGSTILADVNRGGLFGKNTPKYWLAAQKDLVQNDPELVKRILKAHVLLTEQAVTDKAQLPEISRKAYLKFFEDRRVKMDDILKKNTPEVWQKKWKNGEFTYDPNSKVVTEFFNFLDKRGLVKGQTVDGFINLKPLNEVLTDMGKPTIK